MLPLLVFNLASAQPLLQNGNLDAWEYQSFDDIPQTDYQVLKDDSLDGKNVVFANSQMGASGYIRKVQINLETTPWLHFQWRIDETGGKFDEQTKDGDDFAFRIYFAARDGVRYKSLSLVRAQAQQGTTWKSPYAKWFNDLRIYAVIGGDEPSGQWQSVSVNLSMLWKELFQDEPPVLELVGFMTDADSSASSMNARYGDIILTDSPLSPFQ